MNTDRRNLDCGGRAQRRHRFRAASNHPKAAWRFASRRTPKSGGTAGNSERYSGERGLNWRPSEFADMWSAPAKRSGDGALDLGAMLQNHPPVLPTPSARNPRRRGGRRPSRRTPKVDANDFGVRRQSEATTTLWILEPCSRTTRRFSRHPRREIQGGVAARGLPAALQKLTPTTLECAGRAERRRRFGSWSHAPEPPAGSLDTLGAKSKAAWRPEAFPPHSKNMAHDFGVRRQSEAATALWISVLWQGRHLKLVEHPDRIRGNGVDRPDLRR